MTIVGGLSSPQGPRTHSVNPPSGLGSEGILKSIRKRFVLGPLPYICNKNPLTAGLTFGSISTGGTMTYSITIHYNNGSQSIVFYTSIKEWRKDYELFIHDHILGRKVWKITKEKTFSSPVA